MPSSADATDPRLLAARFMPPGELRDEYLEYLRGLGLEAPDAPPADGPATPRVGAQAAAGGEGGFLARSVAVALAAVVFAAATWALTTLS